MYRLLLVDDEPLEREVMRLLMEKYFPEIDVCGEAQNGFEALDLVDQLAPDILFVDINMPGLDGLSTIQRIKERGHKSRCVILTSYSSFEYARTAITLGVEDFLLKPADLDSVRSTLQRVISRIDAESGRDQKQKKMIEQLHEMQPVVESDLLRHIIENRPGIPELFSLLELRPDRAFVFILESSGNLDILKERMVRILHSMGCSILSKTHSTRVIVLVLHCGDTEGRDKIMRLLDKALFRTSLQNAGMGAGCVALSVEQLHDSYKGALESLLYARERGLSLCFPGDIEEDNIVIFPIMRYAELLCLHILQNDREELLNTIELFFADLYGKGRTDLLSQQTFVYQAAILVSQKISEKSGIFSFWDVIQKDKTQILKENDLSALKVYFLHYMEKIFLILKGGRETRQDSIVKEVLNFMKDHFAEPIVLEDLAESVQLSSSHLSKIIKKRTGKNFPDILNQYRINEAMRLLRSESLSMKEVTFRVGYNSQHYFSRIFKKETGFSPSDFRWGKS